MKKCVMCSGATTKTRYVILSFDIVSEIITFEKMQIWERKTSKFGCGSKSSCLSGKWKYIN